MRTFYLYISKMRMILKSWRHSLSNSEVQIWRPVALPLPLAEFINASDWFVLQIKCIWLVNAIVVVVEVKIEHLSNYYRSSVEQISLFCRHKMEASLGLPVPYTCHHFGRSSPCTFVSWLIKREQLNVNNIQIRLFKIRICVKCGLEFPRSNWKALMQANTITMP